MMTNLADCTSGAFGGLFAYAIQSIEARRGLIAWRWLSSDQYLLLRQV